MTAGDLIHLFQEAAQARREERAAFYAYGGYSWGYHGAPLIERCHEAEKRAEEALNAYVDERVRQMLVRMRVVADASDDI